MFRRNVMPLSSRAEISKMNFFTLRHLSKRTLHCLERRDYPGMQRYLVSQKAHFILCIPVFQYLLLYIYSKGDRSSTVVKVLFYKSEGRWFDSSWCQWIFH